MSATIAIIISSIVILGLGSAIAFLVGKKQKSSETWIVGGRSLPVYVVAGSQFATGVGGGVLVAHIGIGYSAGWSAITYNLLYSIGIVLLVLLAGWLKKQNFSTLPDIFKNLYGEHRIMMSLVTILAIVVPFGWLCTQLVAFGNLFTEITGISFTILIIIFAAISLLFVLPGGLASVAWTDFVYGCFMLVLSIASGLYMLNMAGGWSGISANVPNNLVSFPEGLGAVGLSTIVLWIFAIFPGALTNQMSYQRIYAAKDANTAKRGFIIAAIVGVISGVWASFMGIAILSQNPGLSNPEMASGWFLTQIPTWFLSIYAAFIIATIMSTVSSAVQSVVVNITKDIYQSYINPDVSDKKLIRSSRMLSVFVIFLAILLALYYPKALGWLQATYAYSAAGLLVPIFLGFSIRRTNFLSPKGAIGSIVLGVAGAAVAQIIDTEIPYAVFGVAGSLIGFLIFNAIFKNETTKKRNAAKLDIG
ncbi:MULTISPECIES: sodium:solute symporter family protein [Virgibacillus]|uniref:Na(+)/glucose symporter n=2 Tax=Virgibacillus TaxID=84406 RepID=A0A024Q8T4_9BACI|nr:MULTISPECIES: sodium:solute symporter family protein [Virgibacillus]EQB37856.1 sodium:proline symporter [Virgibacillus sp. CM-4]MYL40585.1 sodium:solute symporter family protein [Virgibacillus massiliensis]GGJ57696.1 sodium:proline symporter [Virgibacillus kapii]CDQ38620.1 Na(+)/glucose symporter [Virgibacillus massiliensis]